MNDEMTKHRRLVPKLRALHLVPKLCLGTKLREAPLRLPGSRASITPVPKQSLGTRNLQFLVILLLVLGPWTLVIPALAAPNVVMIIGDDQGWADFGFMGHKEIRTPNLDRLASQSLLFTRGYVPSSLCRASLATLITGLYPHQHKITSNDPPKGTDRAAMLKHIEAVPTLPKLLGKSGYQSLQTGKWWEGKYQLGGFTHGMTHGDPARKPPGRHGDVGLRIGREGMQPIYDFIDGCGEKPFFIWYAPMLPHEPHNPPQRLLSKYQASGRSEFVARYWAMCEWFDETCGELLTHLEKKGLADNTLVAFVTDNGWIQRPDARGFAPKSKRSPYDGGLRTPIMLRWPGKIKPRRDEESLVLSLDLAPTILRAAGLAPPTDMPGVNLLDIAAGKPVTRGTIFGEIFTHDTRDIDRPAASLQYRWCIDGHWKLIVPQAPAEMPELYDLSTDPAETKNLRAERPELLERLTQKTNAWWDGKSE
jgi:uncharacterized sulfatase